jgi:hypothetical protein
MSGSFNKTKKPPDKMQNSAQSRILENCRKRRKRSFTWPNAFSLAIVRFFKSPRGFLARHSAAGHFLRFGPIPK